MYFTFSFFQFITYTSNRLHNYTINRLVISVTVNIPSNYTYNNRDFPYFWVYIVKVVCCRIVVCGKGLYTVFISSCLLQICCILERNNMYSKSKTEWLFTILVVCNFCGQWKCFIEIQWKPVISGLWDTRIITLDPLLGISLRNWK